MSDITYDSNETEFILYVMRNFEISHNMGNGYEMIPMKMKKTPPRAVDKFPKKKSLHLRWKSSYLPNNLVHRLMIRKYPELDATCAWRTGAIFKRIDRSALVQMNDNILDVYVQAIEDSRQYMEEFRVEIQRILHDININAEEIICFTIDGKEGQIPYRDVIRQYHDRREEIYIPGLECYISPAKLLKEVYFDWERETKSIIVSDQKQPVKRGSEDISNYANSAESTMNAFTALGKIILWILRKIFHIPI